MVGEFDERACGFCASCSADRAATTLLPAVSVPAVSEADGVDTAPLLVEEEATLRGDGEGENSGATCSAGRAATTRHPAVADGFRFPDVGCAAAGANAAPTPEEDATPLQGDDEGCDGDGPWLWIGVLSREVFAARCSAIFFLFFSFRSCFLVFAMG